MADQFIHDHADRFMPWEDTLSSEERREQSLRNLADARAEQKKQIKRKKAEASEHYLAEAERFAIEQERIIQARELRRAQSEANRQMAAFGGVFYDDAAGTETPNRPPVPEMPRQSAPNSPKHDGDDNNIDIDIPTEKPAPQKKVRSKKKKKTKQVSSKSKQTDKKSAGRSSSGKRYESGESSKKQHSRISAGGAVALGLLTGLLIGTVIYGRVQTNEIYTEIAALQTDYDDLTARNVSMKSEMESKLTVKKIEEYAEDVLGLMPLNQSQIEYIQLQTEDEVIISEPEDNFFVAINDYLIGIWEYLRGN